MNYDTDLFFKNNGVGSGVWEPLSSSFYQNANLNVDITSWLTGDAINVDIKPAVKTENGEYEEGPLLGSVSFEYSAERIHSDAYFDNDGRGKDSVKILANADPVSVDMSKKAASAFYVIIVGNNARNDLKIDENYVDGTTEKIEFTPLDCDSTWDMRYECEYYAGRRYGWPARLYDNNISNVTFEITMYKIPLNAAKQIKSLSFYSTNKDYFLLAINEVPLSNAQIKENILKTYSEVVKDGKVDESDPSKIKQLIGYYDEMLERNMNIASIDKGLINQMEQMILSITPAIYRKDKNTVSAEFNFNVPVDPATLSASVLLNNTAVTDFDQVLADNDTKLYIDIPVSKDTSGEVSVILGKNLAPKAYPNMTIIYDYTQSVDIKEFMTSSFDEETGILTLTNNSAVTQDCIINSGIYSSDRKTVHFAQNDEITLEPGKNAQKKITLYDAYKSMSQSDDVVFYLSVTDENLKPISEVSELRSAGNSISGADYTQPVLQLDTNNLKINGFLSENEIVTVNVSDQNDTLIYSDNMLSNSDGYFDFEILLKDQNINESGYLKIEIGADSLDEKYTNNNIYFSTYEDRYDIINILANAKSTDDIIAIFD